MSKVSDNAAAAFCANKPFKNGASAVYPNIPQTQVLVETKNGDTVVTMRLHGNLIATKYVNKREVTLSLAGYGTATTRSRLNAIIDHLNIDQRNGGHMGYSQVKHEQVFTDAYGDVYTIDADSVQFFIEW